MFKEFKFEFEKVHANKIQLSYVYTWGALSSLSFKKHYVRKGLHSKNSKKR